MALPVPVLGIDLSGTAFGAPPSFGDFTSHLTTGGDGSPISITYCRQDEQGEVPPATCTLMLDNTSGQWTPGNPAASVNWRVGARLCVQEVHNSTTYDRFDGYVDSIEPAFPGSGWSVVRVSCTDVLGRIAQVVKPMRTMYEHEVLQDSPSALYMCIEQGNAGQSVADSSGNARPAGTLSSFGEGSAELGQIGFFGQRAIFDDVGALRMNVYVNGGAGATDGGMLTLPSGLIGDYPWSFEAEIVPLTIVGAVLNGATIVGTFPSNGQAGVFGFQVSVPLLSMVPTLSVMRDDGTIVQMSNAGFAFPPLSRAYFACGVKADGVSLFMQINGSELTGTAGSALTTTKQSGYVTTVGAAPSSYDAASRRAIPIVVGGVAMHADNVLGPIDRRVQRQFADGHLAEEAYERAARLLRYAVPANPPNPVAPNAPMIGPQRTLGRGVLDVLREVARSGNGVAFASRSGAIAIEDTYARLNQSADLTLTSAEVDPSFMVRQDRQGQFNQQRANVWWQGREYLAKDAANQTRDGVLDGGAFEMATNSTTLPQDIADWNVQAYKNPLTRIPDLTIDLLSSSTSVVDGCLALDIGSKVAVTGLPSTAPATSMTVFVEGYTETIGVNEWRIGLFTSPVTIHDNQFTLDSATFGVLDDDRLSY